jgi:hypothetical protein
MKEQIIKDLMEAVHDIAKIKGENEALRNENKFLRELLTKQLNILPVSNSVCLKCGNTGRCEPRTLSDPDGQECDCGANCC